MSPTFSTTQGLPLHLMSDLFRISGHDVVFGSPHLPLYILLLPLLPNGVFSQGNIREACLYKHSLTPNPASLMSYPDKLVTEFGSANFPNPRSAMNTPLAKALYGIDGSRTFKFIDLGAAADLRVGKLLPDWSSPLGL